MMEKSSIFTGLITSKLRVRILMRLFLNPSRQVYLRELASEFAASSGQVREELLSLHRAGLLTSQRSGRQVLYRADTGHPLFPELQSMVGKALGMDRILESIVERLGNLERVLLLDDYAEGKDTGIIDLVLVGDIDQRNLGDIVAKTERYIGRKIRTLVLTAAEHARLTPTFDKRPYLVLWETGAPAAVRA